jgi:trafficking protein particle complex subunit 8
MLVGYVVSAVSNMITQDMLPLLSSPSPAIPLHVSNALIALHPSANETPPSAQLRALVYANRWETGINGDDFLGNVLEGDRWMVWAAGAVTTTLLEKDDNQL